MNKTKIEWCDYTWNPVSGCLHGCEYCYAQGIARRFDTYDKNPNLFVSERNKWHRLENPIAMFEVSEPIIYVQNGKKGRKEVVTPYPFGFTPTFHRYRLDEPQKVKKPQTIFVCSMADLFGDFMPDEWIAEVFKACEAAPWHRYLFLTKNPTRLPNSSYIYNGVFDRLPSNMWLGATVTCQQSLEPTVWQITQKTKNVYLSIEPLQSSINLNRVDCKDVIFEPLSGKAYTLGGDLDVIKIKWVIIGAESGYRKDKVIPKREWIEAIAEQCRTANVPLFMKDSLVPIVGEGNMIQEYPW